MAKYKRRLGRMWAQSCIILVLLWFLKSQLERNVLNDDAEEDACVLYWKNRGLHTLLVDQNAKVVDYDLIRETRLFGECFVKKQHKCDQDQEAKVYDWFSGESPILSDTGESLFNLHDGCKFPQIKRQLRGKGIVISAADFHFKELAGLITLLRALETKLPIQIIHRGDITDFSMTGLQKVAHADVLNVETLRTLLDEEKRGTWPNLDIQFIDVSPVIKHGYETKFVTFSNKLLALLFNSFEEIVLVDVDTVPFVALQEVFEFPEYETTGAYFFRDRAISKPLVNTDETLTMFHRLMPQEEDSQFGIKQATHYTLNNTIFKGFSHLQESGMVIMNHLSHFEMGMMALTLSLFQKSLMETIWGDKELYWLSMSVIGDESYHFNENFAASIGEISTGIQSHFPNSKSKELCSSHPAHLISKGDTYQLVWMNSGFNYCKNIISEDAKNPFFLGWNTEDTINFRKSPMKIRQALIPPVPSTPYKASTNPNEPAVGWVPRDYCDLYTVCAYEQLGNGDKGQIVEFTESEARKFDHLGMVWSRGIHILTCLKNLEDTL